MKPASIKQYERKLLDLRARLTGEVDRMIDAIQEDMNPSGNLSHLPIHLADAASDGVEAEAHLIQNEQQILSEVQAALQRIHDGTFGVCQNCQCEIADARLDALPYTAYCVECAGQLQNAET